MLDILETLVLSVVLFLAINAVSARVRVDGFSMLPTLHNGEFVLVNRLAYRFGQSERGDIIVFRFPVNPKEDLIKRVIGLPGEDIVITDGHVYVNGALLVEGYIAASPKYVGNWNVPEDHLFVLGDNRNDSSDSHSWGLVPLENVVGKAVLVYWPFDNWMLIKHDQLVLATP
ncbi:MAG: signal peptidase I [Chloroflexi bacterium]|nr:signal peptidase I [Chloroflexota bacterium]